MSDYLQIMNAPGRCSRTAQEISVISRSLKALAKELECGRALSRFARDRIAGWRSVPALDLRDSGPSKRRRVCVPDREEFTTGNARGLKGTPRSHRKQPMSERDIRLKSSPSSRASETSPPTRSETRRIERSGEVDTGARRRGAPMPLQVSRPPWWLYALLRRHNSRPRRALGRARGLART